MDFVRSNFGTNEPLPVEHTANRTKSEEKKCSTGRGSFVPKLLLTKSILQYYKYSN